MSSLTQLRNQMSGIIRVELHKQLRSRAALSNYILVGLFLTLMVLMSSWVGKNFKLYPPEFDANVTDMNIAYLEAWNVRMGNGFGRLYYWFFLKIALFFGCLKVFLNLFRGELLERSLHFYFLTPTRREVLVLAKFFSGFISTSLIFGGSVLVAMVIYFWPISHLGAELITLDHLKLALSYTSIAILGCLAYGTVFMMFGFFVRNALVPAIMFFGWEWLSFLWPPVFKKMTIIYYLRSLTPQDVYEGPIMVLAEPTPFADSWPLLAFLVTVSLGLVCWWIRRMDISYSE